MKDYKEIAPPNVIGMTYVFSKAWAKGDLRIWITRDVYGSTGMRAGSLRWHMSISTYTRYPTWNEIRDAWYALKPPECKDVTVAMMLPPEREYVNLHPNCFHLHEIID